MLGDVAPFLLFPNSTELGFGEMRSVAQHRTTSLTYPWDLAEARLHCCCTVRPVIQGSVGKHNVSEAIFLTALALSETDTKNETKHKIITYFLKSSCFTMF